MKPKKTQKKTNKVKAKNERHLRYDNEIIGILIFAFGTLTLLSFYFRDSIGLFGVFIRDTLTGLFGITAFLIPPLIIAYSFFVIFKRDRSIKLRGIYAAILLILISALVHVGYYRPEDYQNITPSRCVVKLYTDGKNLGGGGILGGMVSMPFLLVFRTLGTIIILTALSLIDIILLTNISIANFLVNLKGLFGNIFRNASKLRQGKISGENPENTDFEPGIIENGGNLELEFKSKPKIIDFKIEKTSRELKERTSYEKPQTWELGSPAESETEPVQLVINDIRKNKTGQKQSGRAVKEIHENIRDHTVKAVREYCRPPLELLSAGELNDRNIRNYRNKAIEAAKKLEETLSSFGVEAKVINISRGPAVTRFELQPSAGVKVSKIVNLADDISLNLASSGVRIEAPIPGKAAIGIEVPNKEIMPVFLRDVIESEDFQRHPSKLSFALGKDISGECVVGDIARMPHLLIAGATGAGKSVCINSLIISLLYKSTPDEVKLVMIDPKVVELNMYNGIPHLLIPVVTDPRKAAGALNWAVQEMINRYKLFADIGVRDLKGYNAAVRNNPETSPLAQIVIIIDELADLMMAAPNEVEDAICRLAQMARAAGMHLVIATQRPSVDVITGVIKANIPSRISFAVSSQIDSRTILDSAGAEKTAWKGRYAVSSGGTAQTDKSSGGICIRKRSREGC